MEKKPTKPKKYLTKKKNKKQTYKQKRKQKDHKGLGVPDRTRAEEEKEAEQAGVYGNGEGVNQQTATLQLKQRRGQQSEGSLCWASRQVCRANVPKKVGHWAFQGGVLGPGPCNSLPRNWHATSTCRRRFGASSGSRGPT